jgi:hypothetical protein
VATCATAGEESLRGDGLTRVAATWTPSERWRGGPRCLAGRPNLGCAMARFGLGGPDLGHACHGCWTYFVGPGGVGLLCCDGWHCVAHLWMLCLPISTSVEVVCTSFFFVGPQMAAWGPALR